MRALLTTWALFVFVFSLVSVLPGQEVTHSTTAQKPSASVDNNKEKNIKQYIELLRADVRREKAEIMGALMQLDVDQSAKFWPIYSSYDAELTKLNDLRVANIEEYGRSYNEMTDAKADQLIQTAMKYRNQRSDLLARYYERIKQTLGGIQAARFVQVEDQLLLIIDLQIASLLPTVSE